MIHIMMPTWFFYFRPVSRRYPLKIIFLTREPVSLVFCALTKSSPLFSTLFKGFMINYNELCKVLDVDEGFNQ